MKLLKLLLKIALCLVLVLVLLGGILFACKDTILRSVVEHQIHAQTGMPVYIGRFTTSLTTGDVHIQDLRLYNTGQFGSSAFLQMPELYLEYNPESVASGKLGFKVVRLNLSELNVVRGTNGQLNVDLKPLQKKVHPGASQTPGPKAPQPKVEFGGIGTLNLTLGKVRYTDLKTPANSYERDLGVRDEVFKKIKSEDDLYGVLLLLMWRHGVDFGGNPAGGILPLKL